MNTDLLINGEFIETKTKQDVINPSTGEVICRASVASEPEVDAALASARVAFDTGPWPKFSLQDRKATLLKIAQGILEQAGELARLETLNTGKPIKESTFMDVPSAAQTFEYVANHFQEYLKTESPSLSAEAESLLQREPRGVVVLIVPWNYPLLIASWKLASALAAGNTVILKPSGLTPLTALALGKIIADAKLPRGVVSILNGSGEKIGQSLCADKRVDMISFTGSNAVGRRITEYSAENIKKIIMELGGKSASIILKDADLEAAVNGSLCSIFLNQGQMCTATARIFVEDDIYAAFLKDFLQKAKRIKLGPGIDFQTQMGPLISQAQREKVMQFVEVAKNKGAQLASGGKIPAAPTLKNGFFFEPTVFTQVEQDAPIFQQEIFGPVAIVNKFSDLEEVTGLANATDFALACTIWTRDRSLASALANKINAGIIWVNTYGMFYPELPYGGFKQSGFGKELGREGFLEYTRLKSIIFDQSKEDKPLVNYWYGF